MRCKQHFTDLSSNVGVCASCLRERLFPLVIAQPLAQTLAELNDNQDTHTDPVFPRSVSPYITRRKANNSVSSMNNQHNSHRNQHHDVPDRLFFSTPQVATKKKKHSLFRFSLLANLFRSKKRKDELNPRSSVCDKSATSATSGGGCRKKQPVCLRKEKYCSDRGMSPVRYSDCDDAEDELYETSESRKPTPWRTPVRGGGGGGNGKNVYGVSFWLSPLVRASPCRNRNQKGVVPVDYGEIGAPVKGNRCNTRSSCGNRSRKVADFGRIATNR